MTRDKIKGGYHDQSSHQGNRRIERIAVVTDSHLGTVAPALAKHFVAAQIRRFLYSESEEALPWLKRADTVRCAFPSLRFALMCANDMRHP